MSKKFHEFWKQNRNPITMGSTKDNLLHRDNVSREQIVARERLRESSSEIKELKERIKNRQDD